MKLLYRVVISVICIILNTQFIAMVKIKEQNFIDTQNIQSINVYNNGKTMSYCENDEVFKNIVHCYENTIKNCHIMPALGVSINDEIEVEIMRGVWLEFVYNGVYCSDGMPYQRLLFNIGIGHGGVCLHRYNNNKYEGRCFYIALDNKNFDDLYCLINNVVLGK